jgi:hypothetical protein
MELDRLRFACSPPLARLLARLDRMAMHGNRLRHITQMYTTCLVKEDIQ